MSLIARRPFIMVGRQVSAGDVVDIDSLALPPYRITELVRLGYGQVSDRTPTPWSDLPEVARLDVADAPAPDTEPASELEPEPEPPVKAKRQRISASGS